VGGPFAAERVYAREEDPFTNERACKDKTPPNHKERALKEGEFRWERASYKEDACGLQSVRCARRDGRKTRSVCEWKRRIRLNTSVCETYRKTA
jgi:hypothetical protein